VKENLDSDLAFVRFLVAAKSNTYASEAAEKKVLLDGAEELTYRRGSLVYRDRYFGGIQFHGQEVVFQDGRPTWSMVYSGTTTDGREPSPDLMHILRAALRAVPEEMPFRGPSVLREGNLEYKCEVVGTVGCFEGKETIFRSDKQEFRLVFSGGWIKA